MTQATISHMQHYLEVNGIEAPPCSPLAPLDMTECFVQSPKADTPRSPVQWPPSPLPPDASILAVASPLARHDRATSQVVYPTSTAATSPRSMRASLRRRTRSLQERSHHARLSNDAVEIKLKELEANMHQVC